MSWWSPDTTEEWIAWARRLGEKTGTYRATLRGKAKGRFFGLYCHIGDIWFIQGLNRLRFVPITPVTLETLLATGELTMIDRKEAA